MTVVVDIPHLAGGPDAECGQVHYLSIDKRRAHVHDHYHNLPYLASLCDCETSPASLAYNMPREDVARRG